MESSLHRELKRRFAGGGGDWVEVRVGCDRVDAIAPDGRLVEVQCGPTASLRPKLGRLLESHRVLVAQPVIEARRILRLQSPSGPVQSARTSPKRGGPFDGFEHLIGLAGLLSHPGLEFVVLAVEVDEDRLPGRGRRGYSVLDRRLRTVVSETPIRGPDDLWALLPDGLPDPFTTRDLAERSGRPEWLACRAAYCLRVAGAAVTVGCRDRRRAYRASGLIRAARTSSPDDAGSGR
jgi:hypothetical protein